MLLGKLGVIRTHQRRADHDTLRASIDVDDDDDAFLNTQVIQQINEAEEIALHRGENAIRERALSALSSADAFFDTQAIRKINEAEEIPRHRDENAVREIIILCDESEAFFDTQAIRQINEAEDRGENAVRERSLAIMIWPT